MKLPTNDLAAMAWLRTIPGLPSQKISTKLPGKISVIAEEGFITVRTVGGSSDVHLPRRSPVIEVQAWACHPESDDREPPWAKANNLVEIIREFCEDVGFTNFGGVIPTKSGYYDICVPSAITQGEPTKIEDDEARFACYRQDILINWTRRAN
jgi:hypothetical protein